MAKSAQAFRTIREVADWLGVAAHVLRFWESKFTQIKPVKRAGGRRYYRPEDMALVGGIKVLLHDKGQTIRAVQRMIRDDGVASVSALAPPLPGDDAEITAPQAAEMQDAAPAMADEATAAEETPTATEDAAPAPKAAPETVPEEASETAAETTPEEDAETSAEEAAETAPEADQESDTNPDEQMTELQLIDETPAEPVPDTTGPTHERFADGLAELAQMAPEFPKNRSTRKALKPHIARLEKLQERLRAGGSE